MIRAWWRRRRALKLVDARMRDSSNMCEIAARVLDVQARDAADHAAKLPHGPARDAARMQQYLYCARAAAFRAEAGGDHEAAEAHRADADYWRKKMDQHIGAPQRTADIVFLDVSKMREAGW